MASRTRRLVCSEIGRLPVRTYETVLWDTPATRATSLLVYAAIANPLLTRYRYVSSIRIPETLAKLYSRVSQITRPYGPWLAAVHLAWRASVQLRGARPRNGYSVVSCSSFVPMSARRVTLETF